MKLKNILLSAILLTSASVADDMATKQEGIKYIKMLGGALKSELQAQMKADNTGMAALGFCTAKANEITQDINKQLPEHAKVRRTSLKVRNDKDNQADAIDQKVMNEYVAAIEAKTFTPKDIKVVHDGETTRVYKPLVAKKVCLKCHGTDLSAEISKSLATNYPHDKAIGFKEGDLRGVIVSEIKTH
jgi:hypothetical protein